MIIEKLKSIFKVYDVSSRQYQRTLKKLSREVSGIAQAEQGKLPVKILYGPSFAIYEPCYAHDVIFSAALRMRGAEIVPIYCDRVQHSECNYYGGVWGGSSTFESNCQNCCALSRKIWLDTGLNPLSFSSGLDSELLQKISSEVEDLSDDSWHSYQINELPFGQWARDILVNNYVVGDYRLIDGHERLGRIHLLNLLIVHAAYNRILDEVKPDRVVCNDSFYGMWAILQQLCIRRGIPFYSHWSGTRPGAWCYAYNDASMNLDFRSVWPGFSAVELTPRQRNRIEEWLDGRLSGKDMLLNTASLTPHCTEEVDLTKIRAGKPTALLAANVIWDLAALNKQIVFEDMIEWIAETISWFGRHPEFQLIVKPHPAEQNPAIPETVERVSAALERRGLRIPENVALLTPKSAVTVYQLLPLVDVGIMHTTTVGIEMSARGIPVVTTARSPYRNFGFTVDPVNRDEYFQVLQSLLSGEVLLERTTQMDRAYKFILFQHFHYYSKIDIMEFRWSETPRLKVRSLDDIRPGVNGFLDYVVDSVIAGLPIISAERWPAES